MKSFLLLLALLGSAPLAAWAAPGDLDPTFGSSGTARVGFGAGDDYGVALVTRNGKYLVAGSSDDAEKTDLIVVRYLSDGSPDPTFGVEGIARLSSGPQSNAGASAMAVMSDDRILVAGADNNVPILGRFLSNGAPDLTFGTNGIVSLPGLPITSICGIALQGTKIILCSSFRSGSIYHLGLARLNADGTLDATFDGDGIARFPILVESFATGMTTQADGKIVIVGYAKDSSFHRAVALARCNSNGVLDATFDGDGLVTTYAGSGDSYGHAVAVQGNAPVKLVVVGDNGPPAGPRNALIIRYNANGTLDPTFGPASGTGIIIQPIGAGDDTFRSVTVKYNILGNPDRVIAAGSTKSGTSGVASDVAVCQYLLTGALDTAIDGDGIIVTSTSSRDDRANSVLFGAARIVVAGFSGFGGGAPDVLLIAYRSTNGTLDPSLDGDGIKLLDIGNAITSAAVVALQADGRILLAGTASDPLNAMVVARLNTDGSLDPGFSGDGRTLVTFGPGSVLQGAAHDAVVQSDGRIVLAGTAGSYPLNSVGVARLLSDGGLDPSFSSDGIWMSSTFEEGWGVAVESDGAILIVGNSTGSTSYLRVSRISANGIPDNAFGNFGVFETLAGGAQAFGRDLLVQPDGRIVVAGFVYPTGDLPAQILILRLSAAGALDPTFGTGGMTTVDVGPLSDAAMALARQSDGSLVVCGQSMRSSSASDPCVLRFDAAGHLDPAFSGDGIYVRSAGSNSETFSALAFQPDGRIVLSGSLVLPSGTAGDQLVMRLNPDGSPDLAFGAGGVKILDSGSPGDWSAGVAVLPEGEILVAGGVAYLMAASRLEGGQLATGVSDPAGGPSQWRVGLARPNPAVQGTTIEYELPAGESTVSAEVFDAAGRLVRRLRPSSTEAGARGRVNWDGSGAGGIRVGGGVYFVRLRFADRVETRRVVLR